jgi:NAD(P)-dependent dehydrogenase (short-subunit alcohol dehydrogenase family)
MSEIAKDKVVYVTGAASGLGRSAAEAFVAAGARVVLMDRDAEGGERLATELGDATTFVACDVASAAQVQTAFEQAQEAFGPPDGLISNAGIREINDVLSIDPADWDRVIAVNLSGVFYCGQQGARAMAAAGGGSIVNISSCAGIAAVPRRPAYSAAKAGVIGLTKSMATDLGHLGIRTNAICPSIIRTPLTESYFEDDGFADGMAQLVPLGRPGEPDDIADVLLFLISDMSRYVSGAVISVDGGFVAGKGFELSGTAADSKFAAARSVS